MADLKITADGTLDLSDDSHDIEEIARLLRCGNAIKTIILPGWMARHNLVEKQLDMQAGETLPWWENHPEITFIFRNLDGTVEKTVEARPRETLTGEDLPF